MFTLNVLGPISAAVDGNLFSRFGTNRGLALLIYLAVENDHARAAVRVHQRETLMHLLWPDMPLKSAQGNLRQTLYLLRKGFQDAGIDNPPVLSARQTVQINPDFLLMVDAHEFETGARGATSESRQEAADLYRGPFLADFFLPDSEPFEAWTAEKRAYYGRLALDDLDQLAADYLAQGDYAAAEASARRAVTLDDLHEPAHRQLLQALAAGGQRGDALTHYESFTRQLNEELDIEPDEATKQLIESIRQGELVVQAAATADAGLLPAVQKTPPAQNLPAQTKAFIGREAEFSKLDHLFADPETRLVTILGPGGMGKTQLAIEWARGQSRYQDGVHFVDLAPLESPDQVAPAMAEVFTFPLQGAWRSPEEQMLDYLREKDLLLIFDNFEHIMEAVDFVNEVMRTAPGVRILATSRERLHLSSEWVYALEGLAYPPALDHGHGNGAGDVESYPAVQLLLRRARHMHPGYQLRSDDQESAARICRTTAGMPLAIELAASWIDLLPLGRIADDIERCLDVLETDMRDLPRRHRSIRAAINASWNHLEPAEQRTFKFLSIFRGGFTWEAASAVLDMGERDLVLRRTLSSLRDKSLINYDARGERFAIHELLRQYGAEKLHKAKQGEDLASARERHALYFTKLLVDNESTLKGPRYVDAVRLIESDSENVLAAWDWLVDNERCSELAQAMDSFGLVHEIQGYYSTGQRSFGSLAARWQKRLAGETESSEKVSHDLLFLARALTWQAAFELDRQEAEALLQESLALLDDSRLDEGEGKAERAFTYRHLGQRLQDSQMGRAIDYLEKGLALYQDLEDVGGTADCLLLLGLSTFFVNLSKSKQYLLQASEIYEEIGDTRRLGQTLNWLVGVAGLKGDFEMMEQVVAKFQALVATFEQPAFVDETLFVNMLIAEEEGDYARTTGYREEYVHRLNELGRAALMSNVYLAYIYLHAGQVDKGRRMLREMLGEIERAAVEHDHRLAFTKHALASQALADEEFAMAKDLLQQAIPIYEKNRNFPDLAGAKALIGIAYIGKGDLDAAQAYLHSGLNKALDLHGFLPLAEAFMGIALLLASQGRTRQARRLYELIWRYPRYSGSILYDGIAGKKIRAQTADLSPDELQTIKQQAAEQDIWEAATSLLDNSQQSTEN